MTEAPISPLRARMIEDMTIRKFAPRTQEGYIRAVKGFSAFLGASPDRASFEDLRRYQLHLVASGAGSPTINYTVTALRFLFIVTLRKPQVVIRLPFIREPRKLPIVLSPEEVARLLDAAPGLKSPRPHGQVLGDKFLVQRYLRHQSAHRLFPSRPGICLERVADIRAQLLQCIGHSFLLCVAGFHYLMHRSR